MAVEPNRKIVVFGAGLAGARAVKYFRAECSVVAVIDNDEGKRGTKLCGVAVRGAGELSGIDFDEVVIASVHRAEIRGQLIESGIDPERIVVLNSAVGRGDYECPKGVVLAIVVLGLLGLVGLVVRLA